MIKNLDTRFAAMAAFLAASMASGAAFAIVEIEDNNTIATAQRLVISGGSVEVNGILGNGSLGANDVDFYSFTGTAGDMVTINVDGGILDLGSVSTLDSFMTVRLQTTGTYTVGVTSSAHPFLVTGGGGVGSSGCNMNLTGSYTLIISGVSDPVQPAPAPAPAPVVQQINIEIRPGTPEQPPINPKSKGSIPVALLSHSGFDARGVDTQSLTFGRSGNEHSLIRCFKENRDVDGDGLPDLLCHFDNEMTGFDPSDAAGRIKGRMAAGGQFEGQGYLKVVPVKRK